MAYDVPRTYSEIQRCQHDSGTCLPLPSEPAYLDRMRYRAVHFFGASLHRPLAEAAHYLAEMEKSGQTPHVLCVHEEFSEEDVGSDSAWQVKVVMSDPHDIS